MSLKLDKLVLKKPYAFFFFLKTYFCYKKDNCFYKWECLINVLFLCNNKPYRDLPRPTKLRPTKLRPTQITPYPNYALPNYALPNYAFF